MAAKAHIYILSGKMESMSLIAQCFFQQIIVVGGKDTPDRQV